MPTARLRAQIRGLGGERKREKDYQYRTVMHKSIRQLSINRITKFDAALACLRTIDRVRCVIPEDLRRHNGVTLAGGMR